MSMDNPNFDKRVTELETSVRLANILQAAADHLPYRAKELDLPRPHVLGDLVRWSESDLLHLSHMGERTLRELVNLLAQEGLSLRGSDSGPCKIQGCSLPAAPGASMCDEHRCRHKGCRNPRAHGHRHCHQHVRAEARCVADGCRRLAVSGGACHEHVGHFTPPTEMTNPDAPSIDTPVDDLEVVKAVVGSLRPLPPVSQVRVLRAVCILVGHDAVFLDDPVALERLRTHFTKENL